jgi:serine/threonine-protein kinase
MDFGVAHLASSSMTTTGSILGTPTYMAPEQITEGKTSPATDIFAVGGVLYQVLTMMKPFEAPTLQNLFFKIITEDPRNVSELTPGLPAALDRIVRKAMAKEPGDRYASALEMANDLTNVRSKLSGPSYPASVSLSASVASAIEMSKTHSRKRARTLAFAGGGALAAAALFAIAWSKSGSPKVDAADKAAAVATPALQQPQSVPAGVAPTTVNSANSTAPVVQPPPSATRTKAQERLPVTARDSRSAGATKTAKPVQSRVVAAPPPRVDPPVTSVSPRQDPLPSPPVVVAKPAAQPPPQESAPPVAAPPTAADIAPAVEAFARAIESKDIGAIRRVYPGLTSDQQRRFEQFFDGARTINATFRVANISASSASAADAQLAGVYEFVTVAGKAERQPVTFAVSLRQEGRTWRLTSLR